MAKSYTDVERAEALAVLQANGGNMLRTSKATGIPRVTLIGWSKDVERQERTADVGTLARLDLAEVIRRELDAVFQAMASKRSEATYRELATAAAILIDKLSMLSSAPPNPTRPAITSIVVERVEPPVTIDAGGDGRGE